MSGSYGAGDRPQKLWVPQIVGSGQQWLLWEGHQQQQTGDALLLGLRFTVYLL